MILKTTTIDQYREAYGILRSKRYICISADIRPLYGENIFNIDDRFAMFSVNDCPIENAIDFETFKRLNK